MANLALVNKKTYEEPALLNKLMAKLEDICQSPNTSLTEANAVQEHQSQNAHVQPLQ